MALTFNDDSVVKSAKVSQANFICTITIDLDGSYPTGGYDMTPVVDELKLRLGNTYTILHVEAFPIPDNDFAYDSLTNKLVVFVSSTGAQVADMVDLIAVTGVQLTIWAE